MLAFFDWIPDKAWEHGGYYVLLIVGLGLVTWAVRSVWKWVTGICWEQFLKPALARLTSHCENVEVTIEKLVDANETMSSTMGELVTVIKSTPACRYEPPNKSG